MDLYLPDGSGTEVLERIRKQHHHTRIAITIAAYDTDDAKRLLGPGDMIFRKPVEFDKLLQWINESA